MFSAGFVHRDVSIGNILIFPQKNARLSDLEYARSFIGLANAHAPKTVSCSTMTQAMVLLTLFPPGNAILYAY